MKRQFYKIQSLEQTSSKKILERFALVLIYEFTLQFKVLLH
jgi:hypothetical protein